MPQYLKIIFSIMLVIYLVVALTLTAAEADNDVCQGIHITVNNSGVSDRQFVSAEELSHEIGDLPENAKGMPLASINTQEIRRTLLGLDKVEDVQVVRMTDGSIDITAQPIVPVMRVFDNGKSYYINKDGKRVSANARYHKDVPIVEGHFEAGDTTFTPQSLLPLINYIASDSIWNSFISMVKVKSPNDIILVPVIREHVINIGSPNHFDDKFSRLKKFYKHVLPRQGWEKYDTLTLKWRGQLVASKRRRHSAPVESIKYDDEGAVDTGTMLAGDDVAPGQTKPGMEAHSETPIPVKKANS